MEITKNDETVEREVAVIQHTEIDTQIATAKRFPRSVAKAQQEAIEIATLDEETAAECIYSLPRDGKNIVGPSVRLAEVVYSCWGNLHSGTRIQDIGQTHVVAEAAVWDLERNNKHVETASRRITNKWGKRYNDDMITTTIAAAQSIAFRNAVFRVIPKGVVKSVELAVHKMIAGDGSDLVKRTAKALKFFTDKGVALKNILARLGRETTQELEAKDVVTLRGIANALRDGLVTLEVAFAPREDELPSAKDALESKKSGLEEVFQSEPGEKDPESYPPFTASEEQA